MSEEAEVRTGAGGPASAGFERTPPQDLGAEQSVLGGMLLSKDAIADAVEIIRTVDFYQPKHSIIFDAIVDRYARGEPADAVVVAAALADSGELTKVGGTPYLHTLMSSVPTAANAAYYARIIAERAVLRRLVEAGTRIVQLGYGGAATAGRDLDDVVDLAQQAVYEVTERRVSEDFAPLSDLLQPTLDEIEAIGNAGGAMTGVPTGFTDLDRLLSGLHPGQLIIVAGRPGLGKSTAAMDFVRNAAVRFNLPSVIFSLEMSKIEIVMRLLSAESRVPLPGVLILPVFYLLWVNAENIALVGGVMIGYGRANVFFGLIAPHGLLELTALFVGAGVGLRTGWSWLVPGPDRSRGRALAESARAAVTVALGLAVILLISGLIEAVVTPAPLPTSVRIAIGVLAWAGFLAYIFVLGRRAAAEGATGDLDVELSEATAPTASTPTAGAPTATAGR